MKSTTNVIFVNIILADEDSTVPLIEILKYKGKVIDFRLSLSVGAWKVKRLVRMIEIVLQKPLKPVLHGFLLKEDCKFVPYLKR